MFIFHIYFVSNINRERERIHHLSLSGSSILYPKVADVHDQRIVCFERMCLATGFHALCQWVRT